MGDASQALKEDDSFQSASKQHSTTGALSPIEQQYSEEDQRVAVVYSHKPESKRTDQKHQHDAYCSNFEELLLLLESDKIATIWFDDSVNPHERAYITGWARIFRPDITTHRLQHKEMTH